MVLSLFVVSAWAQSRAEELPVEQAQLAEKFERLEALASRIAELVELDNPDRAEQLRGAIAQSRDLALGERFTAVVTLLEQERFSAAARNQTQLADNLETLLTLLLADPREARLEAERKRLKQAIRDVGRLIREQQSLRAQTLDQESPEQNAQQQDALAQEAERIEAALKDAKAGGKNNGQTPATPSDQPDPAEPSPGEPSEGESAEERAAQRLSKAKGAMKRASGRMSKGDGQGAGESQSDAQRELEQAKQELEEALRQTREEEAMRTLTRLAERLRRIVGEQQEINRLTIEVQELYGDQETPQKRSAAAGLAKREEDATGVATGALRLLEDDGRSVAFVEVLEQARGDMQTVSQRLAKGATGGVTQGVERDIVEALQEAVAALDEQLSEMANRQQDGQQQQASGETQEPPLVDQLAELRMIRSLQKRILSRTQRYRLMSESGEMSAEELGGALAELARRQERAIEAAQSLSEAK